LVSGRQGVIVLVIGDVHGQLGKLQELLRIAPTDKGVCFVGDLIDRGPDTKGVIDLVRKGGYHVVRGNHEQMLVDTLFADDTSAAYCWIQQGGRATLSSYGMSVEKLMMGIQHDSIPRDFVKDAAWMRNLPYYLVFDDLTDKEERILVVSHSYMLPYWDLKDTERGRDHLLWERHWKEGPLDSMAGYFNVFGHTIQKEHPFLKENVACIDTGAYEIGGRLTGLDWPSMKLYMV
jgi:serine/threonine protein phosphatase 1